MNVVEKFMRWSVIATIALVALAVEIEWPPFLMLVVGFVVVFHVPLEWLTAPKHPDDRMAGLAAFGFVGAIFGGIVVLALLFPNGSHGEHRAHGHDVEDHETREYWRAPEPPPVRVGFHEL